MPISDGDFKAALRQWASGVTVVTTAHQTSQGEGPAALGLHGMTASSFTSVSLRPPLVSVCLVKGLRAEEWIAASGRFAVNVLARDQAAASAHFASPANADRRFEDPAFGVGSGVRLGENGCPLLEGAAAHLECRVYATFTAGDHSIIVGEVTRAETFEREPLLYFRGGYGGFTRD